MPASASRRRGPSLVAGALEGLLQSGGPLRIGRRSNVTRAHQSPKARDKMKFPDDHLKMGTGGEGLAQASGRDWCPDDLRVPAARISASRFCSINGEKDGAHWGLEAQATISRPRTDITSTTRERRASSSEWRQQEWQARLSRAYPASLSTRPWQLKLKVRRSLSSKASSRPAGGRSWMHTVILGTRGSAFCAHHRQPTNESCTQVWFGMINAPPQ